MARMVPDLLSKKFGARHMPNAASAAGSPSQTDLHNFKNVPDGSNWPPDYGVTALVYAILQTVGLIGN